MNNYIMVTGGCGFIGTNFIKSLYDRYPHVKVVNVDKLTYAATGAEDLNGIPNYVHIKMDIGNPNLYGVFEEYRPNYTFNFAAESHVDNSINNPEAFFQTNVMGTQNLLNCFRDYNEEFDLAPVFIHISTDEVYGSLGSSQRPSTEIDKYYPNSPYAASKAASDHLVRAYHKTYGLRTITTNCSNNYGAYQHPEKFIPTVILNALKNKPIPIYGTGQNIRDWIYVEDHCRALRLLMKTIGLDKNVYGENFNIGGNGPRINNVTLACTIVDIMGKDNLISYVEDRKGHDFRYDIDSSKIRKVLSWEPDVNLTDGLTRTIDWYTDRFNRGYYG